MLELWISMEDYKGEITMDTKIDENCICTEYDGKGWSVCGFPCPVHNKMSKKELKRLFKERTIRIKQFVKDIKSGRITEEIPF